MADRKHFIVLGLGTFGEALARRLCENGCRVTGVDRDQQTVDSLKDELYEAIVADVSERAALEHLDLTGADAVFVSLGEEGADMSPSLLAVLHAKELGAKHLIVKGISRDHGKILDSVGVERVVYAEAEIAVALADRVTWPNVLDYLAIDSNYSFAEIALPQSLVGQTILESDLRRLYDVWIIAIKDALTGEMHFFPDPQTRFNGDQLLMIGGKLESVIQFRELK